MALPKAVREQEKRSDELLKAAQTRGNTDEGANQAAANGPDLSSVLNPEEAKEPGGKTDDKAAEPAPKPKQEKDYQHMYTVLQSKYNAEVPALHQKARAQGERIAELTEQVASLTAQLEKKGQSTNDDQTQADLDPDEYPPELVAVIKRLEEQNNALKAEIEHLNGNFTSIQERETRAKTDAFWYGLDTQVPDWQEINANQEFLLWLGQIDPTAQKTRQALIEQAQATLDLPLIVAVFNQWKATQAPRQDAPNLEEQLSPNGNAASGQGAPMKATYTSAWIKKFYDDQAKGTSKYTAEQIARIERDIFAAREEGRIRG